VIANMIAREISPEQIGMLNDLIQAATRYVINGIEVVVTMVAFDHYFPDFAFLIHKMVRMENINAIFALAMMENKVYIVGRSRIDDVDVGEILTVRWAAEGIPRRRRRPSRADIDPGRTRLALRNSSPCQSGAPGKHLMSSPPIMVKADVSCAQANTLLTRYNINALLVVGDEAENHRLLGYITRQVIEKTIYHDLGHVPVKDYMSTEIATVST
jgi:tRNA nucleotidyltransferase (CCA-adding enzyme)